MLQLIIIILVLYLIYSTPIILNNYLVDKKTKFEFSGKIKRKLLTENEYNFYIKLKEITDKYNLLIFTKVRLADIIATADYSNFNRIKSKHIDFLICNQQTEFIKFIELDDFTHNRQKNKRNDNIKNQIFNSLNIKIFRIKINEIEQKLQELDEILSKTTNTRDRYY